MNIIPNNVIYLSHVFALLVVTKIIKILIGKNKHCKISISQQKRLSGICLHEAVKTCCRTIASAKMDVVKQKECYKAAKDVFSTTCL